MVSDTLCYGVRILGTWNEYRRVKGIANYYWTRFVIFLYVKAELQTQKGRCSLDYERISIHPLEVWRAAGLGAWSTEILKGVGSEGLEPWMRWDGRMFRWCSDGRKDENSPVFYRTLSPSGPLLRKRSFRHSLIFLIFNSKVYSVHSPFPIKAKGDKRDSNFICAALSL